jgi:pyruvate/2-oxoglutarate dehydrogenase complex dihydrolipoamide acyltransferase (E2) component
MDNATGAARRTELPWPRVRELVTDALTAGHRAHLAHGFAEFDVSRPLALIEEYKPLVPCGVSFTAYLAYCLGHALGEHTMLHAYRRGRKKLVVFDEVDVNTLLEKRKPDGSLVPVTYIVRGANRKSLAEVNHELRQAAASDLYNDPGVRRRRQLMRLPRIVRAALWRRMLRDPARLKREMGTAGLSNVGSFMSGRPSWGVASSFLTCTLTVGGRYQRVYWADGHAEPRTTLSVTITVDHDVVDGAPAARFAETLGQLLESGAGLDDGFLAEATRLSGVHYALGH